MSSNDAPVVINGQHYTMAKSVVKTEDEILAAVRKMAQQIASDYAEANLSHENPLILICVLKGSYILTADLTRILHDLNVSHLVDFVRVSSYGSGTCSSGTLKLLVDIQVDIKGKNVIIIEDIVDSGRTLKKLLEMYRAREPCTLKTLALADKPEGRQVQVDVDYKGFYVPHEFLVGYGLDMNDRFRCVRHILSLKPECYNGTAKWYGNRVPMSKL